MAPPWRLWCVSDDSGDPDIVVRVDYTIMLGDETEAPLAGAYEFGYGKLEHG